MPKSGHFHRTTPHTTKPLIWCVAVICVILAVAVIIAGVVLFIGYIAVRPKVPQISVTSAQLDAIYFDQASLLTVQVTIVINSENHNAKASSVFYGTRFGLSFRGQNIACLVADAYGLGPNKTTEFNYVSQSTPIPLNPDEAEALNWSLKRNIINFELKGNTKTRWRVGLIGSVKFWLHLNCMLELPVNGTQIFPRCSSRSQ
ncbi:LOW QUALITY PROTEIN: NDR1/HIN1-like protein 12 [Primulina huaijiensis]|uniref:LOW QUALITY PROTEIN: NDR1/HIN1-like protein 12 n=1 Tax=Primulina huaijiensis TaxID=1492673 RepID=UPI003CC71F8B